MTHEQGDGCVTTLLAGIVGFIIFGSLIILGLSWLFS